MNKVLYLFKSGTLTVDSKDCMISIMATFSNKYKEWFAAKNQTISSFLDTNPVVNTS